MQARTASSVSTTITSSNPTVANNFEDEIKQGLKLVEFYTTWCGYCKKQLYELEQMKKIWIGQIDADNNTEIHSFLKLEITSKGRYDKLCDLLGQRI